MPPKETNPPPNPKETSSGIKDLIDKLRANPELVDLLLKTIDKQKGREKEGK